MSKSFDLDATRELFRNFFTTFENEGYFQEALGYECVDNGFVAGSLGQDLAGVLLLELRKKNLTPIRTMIEHYSEEDMFDMIEFLYEHCSKPVDGWYHIYNQCGYHYHKFNRDPGREEFRTKINKILALYNEGYELSAEGEILLLAGGGLENLVNSTLPKSADPHNISIRVEAAKTKFLRYRFLY
jgi:hypothetical protein